MCLLTTSKNKERSPSPSPPARRRRPQRSTHVEEHDRHRSISMSDHHQTPPRRSDNSFSSSHSPTPPRSRKPSPVRSSVAKNPPTGPTNIYINNVTPQRAPQPPPPQQAQPPARRSATIVVDYSPKSSAGSLPRPKHSRHKPEVEIVREYDRERYIPVPEADPGPARVAHYHVEGGRQGDRRSVGGGGGSQAGRRTDPRASTGSYRSTRESRETYDDYGRLRRRGHDD